jgi:signal transduction histidine kinase
MATPVLVRDGPPPSRNGTPVPQFALYLAVYLLILGTQYVLLRQYSVARIHAASDLRGWLFVACGMGLLWTSVVAAGVVWRRVAYGASSAAIAWTVVQFAGQGAYGVAAAHGLLASGLLLGGEDATVAGVRIRLLGFVLGLTPLLIGAKELLFGATLPGIEPLGLSAKAIATFYVIAGAAAAFTNVGERNPAQRRAAHLSVGAVSGMHLLAIAVWTAPGALIDSAATLYRLVVTAFLPAMEQGMRQARLLTLRVRFAAAFGTVTWFTCLAAAFLLVQNLFGDRTPAEFRLAGLTAFWVVMTGVLLSAVLGVALGGRFADSVNALITRSDPEPPREFGLDELDEVAGFLEETKQVRRLHELAARLMHLRDLGGFLSEILAAGLETTRAARGAIQLLEADGVLRVAAQQGFAAGVLPETENAGADAPARRAIASRARVLIADPEQQDAAAALQCTPMISNTGGIAGVLVTCYDRPAAPNERESRLLDLLARQAADLIEKQREEHARQKAEAELQQRAVELDAANQNLEKINAELEAFNYVVAHDLREPLRGIRSFADLAIRCLTRDEGAKARDLISRVADMGGRMDGLMTSLLDYARLGSQPLETSRVSMHAVLRDALQLISAQIEDTGAEVVVREPLPGVEGDRRLLTQVVMNLISNGIKYNDSRRKRIEVGAEQVAGETVFHVRDNGIGIAPENAVSIFQIFRRLHGRDSYGGGVGAGLTIVRRIVERHGGRIWLESQPGAGSTFYFTIGQSTLYDTASSA